jgi:hypothetical protein
MACLCMLHDGRLAACSPSCWAPVRCLTVLLPCPSGFTNNQNIHFIAHIFNISITQVLNHTHYSQPLYLKYTIRIVLIDLTNQGQSSHRKHLSFQIHPLQGLDDVVANWPMLQVEHSSHHDHNYRSPYPLIHSF